MAVSVKVNEGTGERGRGIGEGEASGASVTSETSGMVGTVVDPATEQAANARMVKAGHTDKYLFFIIILNFQLHLPDGFQQWPALFETRFTQVA
jgi:hypothetical protein